MIEKKILDSLSKDDIFDLVSSYELLVKGLKKDIEDRDEMINKIFARCKIVLFTDNIEYPLEHNMAANKDMRDFIQAKLNLEKKDDK